MTEIIQPQYEDYIPLVVKVLGREAYLDGAGHEPFMKALKTHSPEKGKFSTWLWHNLQQSKMLNGNSAKRYPHPNCFLEIEETMGLNSVIDPHDIIEFRNEISTLSADAKAIIKCLFKDMENTCKRTKWPSASTCNKREIRKYIKEYCRETLNWSWPRYWSAVHEIEEILK